MKRPKPRDYGLDSDHPTTVASVSSIGIDPAQPFTQTELHTALTRLVEREALRMRQYRYASAISEYDYNNGGR